MKGGKIGISHPGKIRPSTLYGRHVYREVGIQYLIRKGRATIVVTCKHFGLLLTHYSSL